MFAIATGAEMMPVLLTLPTFVIAAFRLNAIKRSEFSAQDMLWLTILLFFVIAPIQSISNHGFLSGTTRGASYELEDFVLAQSIVTISVAILALFDRRIEPSKNFGHGKCITDDHLFLIVFICLISFVAYVASSGGISNVLLPRREKSREEIFILRLGFLAVLAVGTMVLAAKRRPWGLLSTATFVACAALLLVCVNPLNSARFFLVASWFPVIALLLGPKLRFVPVFAAMLFGVLVFMPLASLTSRVGVGGFALLGESEYAKDVLRIKDMDVFDTLVHACRMMRHMDYMIGENALAILLFFVPRTVWPDKPIVGGLIVGNDLYTNWYAGTQNLSFYVAGDLYLDFGLLGVAAGFVVIGYLWRKTVTSSLLVVDGSPIFSAILMGSLPILIRGPLGAVIGYFFCLTVACFMYSQVLRFRRARSNRRGLS
ncbi:hypothetical protein CSC68_11970 [Pseudoxanthomonas suwonensis]|nr:hypothetical protein CSC68_11970 [Pseudoxanthomonas suwonensis]